MEPTIGSQGRLPFKEDILAQLERMLSNKDFTAPNRLHNFLRFIVEETLAGRARYLGAFTIAQAVFNRGSNFDTANDPCVRIAAAHLRHAIEHYYLTSGKNDVVEIEVPKGGYVPKFSMRSVGRTDTRSEPPIAVAHPSTVDGRQPTRGDGQLLRWTMVGALLILFCAIIVASVVERNGVAMRKLVNGNRSAPILTVEPFQDSSQTVLSKAIARGLTDKIKENLNRWDTKGAAEPTHILKGSVIANDNHRVRALARVVRKSDGVVIWSSEYDIENDGRGTLQIETGIARSIAAAITAPLEKNDIDHAR